MSKAERYREIARDLEDIFEGAHNTYADDWLADLLEDPGVVLGTLQELWHLLGERVEDLQDVVSRVEYPPLTTREHATILAALRALSTEISNGGKGCEVGTAEEYYAEYPSLGEIATDGGQELPMSFEEIDALAERLNTAAGE